MRAIFVIAGCSFCIAGCSMWYPEYSTRMLALCSRLISHLASDSNAVFFDTSCLAGIPSQRLMHIPLGAWLELNIAILHGSAQAHAPTWMQGDDMQGNSGPAAEARKSNARAKGGKLVYTAGLS